MDTLQGGDGTHGCDCGDDDMSSHAVLGDISQTRGSFGFEAGPRKPSNDADVMYRSALRALYFHGTEQEAGFIASISCTPTR